MTPSGTEEGKKGPNPQKNCPLKAGCGRIGGESTPDISELSEGLGTSRSWMGSRVPFPIQSIKRVNQQKSKCALGGREKGPIAGGKERSRGQHFTLERGSCHL